MTELRADVSYVNIVAIILSRWFWNTCLKAKASDKGRHELPLSNAFSCYKRELESFPSGCRRVLRSLITEIIARLSKLPIERALNPLNAALRY